MRSFIEFYPFRIVFSLRRGGYFSPTTVRLQNDERGRARSSQSDHLSRNALQRNRKQFSAIGRGGGCDGTPPWGWWLHLDGSQFHDDQGGRWRSVRDAFWRGYLKMADDHYAEERQELLLRVLASIDGRGLLRGTSPVDLFGGNALMWRFHLCRLSSIGMLEMSEDSRLFLPTTPLKAGRSDEGRSVLLMPRLARQPEWEPPSLSPSAMCTSSRCMRWNA